MDTLGRIILSITERLSSFRGKNVLPLYRLVYQKVSFIRGSTVLYIVFVYLHVVCCCLPGHTVREHRRLPTRFMPQAMSSPWTHSDVNVESGQPSDRLDRSLLKERQAKYRPQFDVM